MNTEDLIKLLAQYVVLGFAGVSVIFLTFLAIALFNHGARGVLPGSIVAIMVPLAVYGWVQVYRAVSK